MMFYPDDSQSAFYPWSAVCSLHFTLSLQSAVCSLRFTLTICRIDVIPTDNSFMHAEVNSTNTLTSSLISFVMVESPVQLRNMHNKTIIGFGFCMIVIIINSSVCVIRLSLRLRQITQTLALIIIAIMLNLIQ